MDEEMTLTLNSPITDEQWDAITDVDFEHTDRIWFKTKHGKEVEFVKRKKGTWGADGECPFCGYLRQWDDDNFCANCGADMRTEGNNDN